MLFQEQINESMLFNPNQFSDTAGLHMEVKKSKIKIPIAHISELFTNYKTPNEKQQETDGNYFSFITGLHIN